MLDRHTLDPLPHPARSCSRKSDIFADWTATTDNLQDTSKSRQRLVIIILRIAHATAVPDMLRKLNEVEIH